MKLSKSYVDRLERSNLDPVLLRLKPSGEGRTFLEIKCKWLNQESSCEKCGTRGSIRSSRERYTLYIPWDHIPVKVWYKYNYYICRKCDHRWYTDLDNFLDPSSPKLSQDLVTWALEQLEDDNISLRALVREVSCCWRTLHRAIQGRIEKEGMSPIDFRQRFNENQALWTSNALAAIREKSDKK